MSSYACFSNYICVYVHCPRCILTYIASLYAASHPPPLLRVREAWNSNPFEGAVLAQSYLGLKFTIQHILLRFSGRFGSSVSHFLFMYLLFCFWRGGLGLHSFPIWVQGPISPTAVLLFRGQLLGVMVCHTRGFATYHPVRVLGLQSNLLDFGLWGHGAPCSSSSAEALGLTPLASCSRAKWRCGSWTARLPNRLFKRELLLLAFGVPGDQPRIEDLSPA